MVDRTTVFVACLQAAASRAAQPHQSAPDDYAVLVRSALDLAEECERQLAERWAVELPFEPDLEKALKAADAHRKRLAKGG